MKHAALALAVLGVAFTGAALGSSHREAPAITLPYTDGAEVHATDFRNTFPYLNTPAPGSPNPAP